MLDYTFKPSKKRNLSNTSIYKKIAILKNYFGFLKNEKVIERNPTKKIKFPKNKPPAFMSIDDRGLRFEGIFPDPEELLNFRPWNKST